MIEYRDLYRRSLNRNAGLAIERLPPEFRKFIALPALIGEPLEIALNIEPQDPNITYLEGCKIKNPAVIHTASLYREYVSGPLGDFSYTKGGHTMRLAATDPHAI